MEIKKLKVTFSDGGFVIVHFSSEHALHLHSGQQHKHDKPLTPIQKANIRQAFKFMNQEDGVCGVTFEPALTDGLDAVTVA